MYFFEVVVHPVPGGIRDFFDGPIRIKLGIVVNCLVHGPQSCLVALMVGSHSSPKASSNWSSTNSWTNGFTWVLVKEL